MGGWDNDESGDYVPSPPPIWFWALVCLAFGGVAALVLFGPG